MNKPSKKKPARKAPPKNRDRGQTTKAMKAIAGLEVIKADLVHHGNGSHELTAGADLLGMIVNSSLAQMDRGSESSRLIIEVVHVNDRGERIQPTEEEREADRRLIEGRHEKS